MSEDKSKLQLIGEIAQANNKNLELIEELKDREDEIERLTELCDKYEEEHKTTFEEWKKTINIINELKEWFKGYHKSYASCKWYEEDYIEFIEHLENELKGDDKE